MLQPQTLHVAPLASGSFNYLQNVVVEIKKLDGSLANIFSDREGLTPLPQDGSSNKTDSDGKFSFFIDFGQYKAEALDDGNIKTIEFNVGSFRDDPIEIAGFTGTSIPIGVTTEYASLYIDGRLIPSSQYTLPTGSPFEIDLNSPVTVPSQITVFVSLNSTGDEDSSGSGSSVYLPDYFESGDTRLKSAWDRMITDITNSASSNNGKRTVILGKNPGEITGVWKHDEPVQILSGMTVRGPADIEWVNTDTSKVYRRQRGMFESIGAVSAISTSITTDISEDDNFITVADASNISVGDFLNVEIQLDGANSSGYFPEIYATFKVIEIDGLNLYIDTTFGWPVNITGGVILQNNVNVIKNSDISKDIIFEDVNFLDTSPFVTYVDRVGQEQPDYVIGPLYFQNCYNIEINNVYGNRMKCPLVQTREFNNLRVSNITLMNPDAIGPGEGYGVQWSRGVFAKGENIKCQNERHVFDFTSVRHGEIDLAQSPKTEGTATFLLHGRFESDIKLRNLTGDTWSFGAGFTFGNWSKGLLMENCNIREILIGGRGSLDWSCFNCNFETTEGRFYTDRLVWDNTSLTAGRLDARIETRVDLSPDISRALNNGFYMSGNTLFSAGDFTGALRVVIEDSVRIRYGGVLSSKFTFTDCGNVKVGGIDVERVELVHTGGCGIVTYSDGFNSNMNFPEYSTFGIAPVLFSSMSIHPDYSEVSINIGSINTKLNGLSTGLNPKPFLIRKGSGDAMVVKFRGLGWSFQNNQSSATISEEVDFFMEGSVSSCLFKDFGLRVEQAGIEYTNIPRRLLVSDNSYINTSSVDNDEVVIGGFNFPFTSSSVPANGGEVRGLIEPIGYTIPADASVQVNLNNVNPGVTVSAFYDNTTDNKWKIKAVNATGSAISLASTLGTLRIKESS